MKIKDLIIALASLPQEQQEWTAAISATVGDHQTLEPITQIAKSGMIKNDGHKIKVEKVILFY